MHALASSYRYRRQHGETARGALAKAREDVAAGKERWPNAAGDTLGSSGAAWSGAGQKHMRFVENPRGAGLRFVGYADEAAPRSVRHTGWYLDEFQDEKARGVVFRLPSRKGESLFLAGIQDPFNGSADANGPVMLSFDEIFRAPADADYQDAVYWAGVRADRMAERYAEDEQEWRAADRAGFHWAELGEEIQRHRADARALVREMKAARRAGLSGWPHLCRALRDRLAAIREESHAAWEKREELWRDYRRADAFKEYVRA